MQCQGYDKPNSDLFWRGQNMAEPGQGGYNKASESMTMELHPTVWYTSGQIKEPFDASKRCKGV